MPWFALLSEITQVEVIATGRGIRELRRLQKAYGKGRWRKLKGIAHIRLPDGQVCTAEVHWYETGTVGRVELKLKHILN